MDMLEKANKLEEELNVYINLEGTEIGEACNLLTSISHYQDYVSKKFYDALLNEMEEQLHMFKTCTTINKREVKETFIMQELEWHHYIDRNED